MKFVNGLIGCALGFAGGVAALALAVPADMHTASAASAAKLHEAGSEALTGEEGQPFLVVMLDD
ncbi:hypothetical protein [Qipengyuania nanhaisediminis]|uniref:hypothetical protein n=1 Tax=Qipengyuania nanhaisediminis TaxID=604088 RepID=UPI0038B2F7C3